MNRNKTIFIVVIALLGIAFIITLFVSLPAKKKANLPPGVHGVMVTEVLQTNNYTYLNVKEEDRVYWMAINAAEIAVGDSLYFKNSMEMKDFKSRELNRTFPLILFVDDAMKSLAPPPSQRMTTPQKVAVKKWSEVEVTVPKGGIALEELFRNIGNYAGKRVTIRGVVTRYNSEIMNRNWVHLQDGTEFEGKFDLTVTTHDSLVVGQQATFTGVISLNKDFGSGYTYDVMMEEAEAADVK